MHAREELTNHWMAAVLSSHAGPLAGSLILSSARSKSNHQSSIVRCIYQDTEYKRIQRAHSLNLPTKPPKKKNWKGSSIAPFAGSYRLVLYQCRSKQKEHNISYHVQFLHNEVPVPLSACGTYFCPFEVFKAQHAVERLTFLKTSKMEELVLKKQDELEEIYGEVHMIIESDAERLILIDLIDSADLSDLLADMDDRIAKAREQAKNCL